MIETICFTAKDHGGDAMEDLAPTLRAGGHSGSHANAGVMPAIAFHNRQDQDVPGDVTHPIGAKDNGMGVTVSPAPTFAVSLRGREGGATAE